MNSKAREALNQLLGLIDNEILVFNNGLDPSEVSQAQYHIDKAGEAYEEPLRNCDVGTAEEQEDRFADFCRKHECTMNCPIKKKWSGHKPSCGILWSQMPYEKGGEE
jgi:hypothetical protein